MDFWSLLKASLLGLQTNRLRAFLTTLGIIIGVATVITMISIIEGLNKYTYRVLGSIGSNAIYIQKWQWRVTFGPRPRRELRKILKRKDITLEDADAIKSLPAIENAVPYKNYWRNLKYSYRDKTYEGRTLVGTYPGYIEISGYEVATGRGLDIQDVLYRRQVVVLGNTPAERLFEDENPIGKTISINGHKFVVVGVLKKRGQLLGNDLDDIAIIPLTTLNKFFRMRGFWARIYGSLSVIALAKPGMLQEALKEIEELMRERRGLRFDEENDFALNTQEMLVEAYQKLTRGIFLAMIFIASLALVVGGIGIMNIMLVSVRERTREIGLRMAVGAKRSEILWQFLLESILLTGFGGLIGVFIGFAIGKIVELLTPLPFAAPLWSVFLGVGFAGIVGLFFGIHPASVAAKMDPIEALRYE